MKAVFGYRVRSLCHELRRQFLSKYTVRFHLMKAVLGYRVCTGMSFVLHGA